MNLNGKRIMYKNILIPVDGSPLSRKAVREAIGLAKTCGARVTGFFSPPEYEVLMYGEYFPPNLMPREEYDERAASRAEKILTSVRKEAEAAGVACNTLFTPSRMPWEAIIATAKKKRCDLIVMASHGRKGLAGVLLGSETTKVLTHSRVPVLVVR
jgi:nucleotide-binding universal stress UspA family protein